MDRVVRDLRDDIEGAQRAPASSSATTHATEREDHPTGNHPSGRIPQHHLGAPAHRRRPGRPGRNLHGRRGGGGLPARMGGPAHHGQGPACDRGAQQGHHGLPGLARVRCGDARQLGGGHRAVGHLWQGRQHASAHGAGRQEPRRHPHLQHLRGLPVHPQQPQSDQFQLGTGQQLWTVRGSAGFSAPCRRTGRVVALRGNHGHEDLAV